MVASTAATVAPAFFPVGNVTASPRALALLEAAGEPLAALLARHADGDDGGGLEDLEETFNATALADRQGTFLGSHDIGGREVLVMTFFEAPPRPCREPSYTRVFLDDEAGEFMVQPGDRRAAWTKAKDLREPGSAPGPLTFEAEFLRLSSAGGEHATLPPARVPTRPLREKSCLDNLGESPVQLASSNGHINRIKSMIPSEPAHPAPPPIPVTAESITPDDREMLRELYRVQPEATPAEVAAQFEAECGRPIHPLTVRHLCRDLPMPPGKPRTANELANNSARKKAARKVGKATPPKPIVHQAPRLTAPVPTPAPRSSDPIGVADAILDALESLSPSDRPRVLEFIARRFPAA